MNFNQLINEIRKLNPNVEIRIGDSRYDARAYNRIFCSKDMSELQLPEGYYYNDKNGITNKHNSDTGLYTSLEVESLDKMNPQAVLPNVDVSKPLATTNVRDIAVALQRLNPGVTIRLANPDLDPQATSKIFSSVPMSELALPQPFYCNDKNGITNKHETASGMYANIDVKDLNQANPSMLVSTGYNLDDEKRRQYESDNIGVLQSGTSSLPKQEEARPQEPRNFTILKQERAMNNEQRAKTRSAIIAGAFLLGACVSMYFSGTDTHQVIQQELNALYSWDSLGQYVSSLGPMTTLLTAGAGAFLVKYGIHKRKFKEAQELFNDMNEARMSEAKYNHKLGGDIDARTR